VEEINKVFPFCSFLKCIYNEEEKTNIIRNMLEKEFIRYCQSEVPDRHEVSQDLGFELTKIASSFKDQTFSEEMESRIVVIEDSVAAEKLRFREGPNNIISYLALPFRASAVTEIVLGPTVDKKRSQSSLSIFLRKMYGLEQLPKTSLSLTPYRSW